MLRRLVAVVCALAPAILPLALPGWGPVRGVALGVAVLGLVLLAIGPRRSLAGLGVGLALTSALVATDVGGQLAYLDEPPAIDLEHEAFPEPPPAVARVSGWFREGWQLDEYAVPEGERPKQSRPAAAVLIPFVGTTADVAELRGAIVVARLPNGPPRPTTKTTIEGRVEPLPDELRDALVTVAGAPSGQVRAFAIDTTKMVRPAEVWTRLALLAALAAAALACLWLSAAPRPLD